MKVLKLDEITNLIWIISIALVVIISIVLFAAENSDFSIFGFYYNRNYTIICIILGILIMILSKLILLKLMETGVY